MTTLHQIDRQLDAHLESEVQRLDALLEEISTEDLETLCAAIDAQAAGEPLTPTQQDALDRLAPQLNSFSDAAHAERVRRVIAELRQSGDTTVIVEMERLIKG